MLILKEKIKQCFNSAANSYDQAAILQNKVGLTLLNKLNRNLSVEVIADMGAGTGCFTPLLSQHYPGAKVLAIDLALQMLHIAKPKSISERNFFACADFDCLPLASQSIDVIYSNLSLQWSLDLTQTLLQWNKVLKPGGMILFSTFGAKTFNELKTCWAQVDDYAHVNHFLSTDLIEQYLKSANFDNIQIHNETLTHHYSDVYAIMRNLKAVGANCVIGNHINSLQGKQKFKNLQLAYEHFKNAQNQLPVTYDIIYVKAFAKQ